MDLLNKWALIVVMIYGYCAGQEATPCDEYELIQCGDNVHEWMYCWPTDHQAKIINVRLDIRYPNVNCRHNNRPINFYMLERGGSMLTTKHCQGTFLLCLKKVDPPDTSTTEQQTMNDLSTAAPSTLPTYDVTTLSDELLTSDKEPTKHQNITEGNTWNYSFFGQDNVSDGCCQMPFAVKYWLIYGVAVGGVTIIALIAFITYITMYWQSGTTAVHGGYRVAKSQPAPRNRYFRKQKFSTSTLLTHELENEESVYASIPVTRIKSNICYENEKQVKTHLPTQPKKSVSQSVSLVSNGTYGLLPSSVIKGKYSETCDNTHARDNKSDVKERCDVREGCENQYDRLRHGRVSQVSVTDINTYNHLRLERGPLVKEI